MAASLFTFDSPLRPLIHPLWSVKMLEFLGSVLVLLISANAASIEHRATCSDGSTLDNAACCDFIALRDDLQENLYIFFSFSSVL